MRGDDEWVHIVNCYVCYGFNLSISLLSQKTPSSRSELNSILMKIIDDFRLLLDDSTVFCMGPKFISTLWLAGIKLNK